MVCGNSATRYEVVAIVLRGIVFQTGVWIGDAYDSGKLGDRS